MAENNTNRSSHIQWLKVSELECATSDEEQEIQFLRRSACLENQLPDKTSHAVPCLIGGARPIDFELRVRPSSPPKCRKVGMAMAASEHIDPEMLPNSSRSEQKIQKVPFLLSDREDFSKLFEPRVVSFGPIHHGKKADHYKEGECFKEVWKQKFIVNNGRKEAKLYKSISKEINKLRNCFEIEMVDKYEDRDLIRILLRDGCAILHYIYCKVETKFDGLNININQAAFVEQDMFLLENQIPFLVLDLLTGLSEQDRKIWKGRINKFIGKISVVPCLLQGRKLDIGADEEWDKDPDHLLALLRERLFEQKQAGKRHQSPKVNEVTISLGEMNWESYRSVIDLKASGINFKAKESRFLNDITYTQHCISGTLEIPPVTIDDSAGPLFMNLIAYEMCPGHHNDFAVTSYIWFLATLIDYAEDVKELRNAHILRNFLGSDDEVAQLFNELATDLSPNARLYKTVTQGIQKHYDHPWWPMLAKLYYSHFNTPWTAIAFFAASIVFILTGVQTYYAIWPRK